MKKNWEPHEIDYLAKNWGKVPLKDIMAALDRTKDSIMRKARRLNLDLHKTEADILKRKWCSEEDNFIVENYGALPPHEISLHLDRTVSAIRKRASALGMTREAARWSPNEEEFLKEKWGILNIDAIAKKLNRSRNSILLRAHQLSLREQITANGVYLTPSDISSILGVNIRTLYSWLWNGKLQHRKFKVDKTKKYQITVENFCKFLENHQDKWNSQKADLIQIKLYYISYFITKHDTVTIHGGLPDWLLEKIDRDKNGFKELLKPWTTKEERALFDMVKQAYKYKDICSILGRSVDSVKTKLHLLKRQRHGIDQQSSY